MYGPRKSCLEEMKFLLINPYFRPMTDPKSHSPGTNPFSFSSAQFKLSKFSRRWQFKFIHTNWRVSHFICICISVDPSVEAILFSQLSMLLSQEVICLLVTDFLFWKKKKTLTSSLCVRYKMHERSVFVSEIVNRNSASERTRPFGFVNCEEDAQIVGWRWVSLKGERKKCILLFIGPSVMLSIQCMTVNRFCIIYVCAHDAQRIQRCHCIELPTDECDYV